MNLHNNKTHRPLKDQDLKTLTYFLRVAGLTVPFICLLGLFIGYVYWGMSGAVSGVVIAAIVGLAISALVMFLLDAASGAASGLLSGRREAVWTIREQVQGFLSQARLNKQNSDHPAALIFVNKVLEKDPEFADALFLKAQILWEGFGLSNAAIQFLEKTLSLKDADTMVHNQALLLHSDLNTLGSPPANTSHPEGIEIGLRSRRSSIAKRLTHQSFQDVKARALETPMARWAIYAAIVFGIFLVCAMGSMTQQIRNFDRSSTQIHQTIENTFKNTQTQAVRIQDVEQTIQAMSAQLSHINDRLKKKK